MDVDFVNTPENSRVDSFFRLVIGVAILVFALGFVFALLDHFRACSCEFGAGMARYVVLMPPPGETPTASWSEGYGELPLLFRYKLHEGSWRFNMNNLTVMDSKGRLLTAYGPCPGFDCKGGLEVVAQPAPRWYEFLKKLARRRTTHANHFLVYRYNLPGTQPNLIGNDRHLVRTENALPIPKGFIVPATRDKFIESIVVDMVEQKASELGSGRRN